jgi:hypothetical protein
VLHSSLQTIHRLRPFDFNDPEAPFLGPLLADSADGGDPGGLARCRVHAASDPNAIVGCSNAPPSQKRAAREVVSREARRQVRGRVRHGASRNGRALAGVLFIMLCAYLPRAVLARCRTLPRPVTRTPWLGPRFLSSGASSLDAQIAEMNAEMEELFGSPVSDNSGLSQQPMGQQQQRHEAFAPRPASPDVAAARQAIARTSAASPAADAAKAALLSTIAASAQELQAACATAPLDVERSTKLACCVAECVRAISELQRLHE